MILRMKSNSKPRAVPGVGGGGGGAGITNQGRGQGSAFGVDIAEEDDRILMRVIKQFLEGQP